MSAVNLPLASVPVATSKEENLTVRSQNYYYLALLKDQGHDNCFIFIFSISSGLLILFLLYFLVDDYIGTCPRSQLCGHTNFKDYFK